MILPCPAPSDGVTLGGFHTHPEPDIPPVPTPSENEDEKSDLDFARECGSEAYIVTDFKAFRYFANGKVGPQINLEKITTCNRKHLVEDPACGKPQDEL